MMGPDGLPPEIRAMVFGPMTDQPSHISKMPASHEITVPVAQLSALSYLAEIGYATMVGDETKAHALTREYAKSALTMREATLDSLLEGLRSLFTALASREGAPAQPANSMAGSLAVLVQMIEFMDEVDEARKEEIKREGEDGPST